MVVAIAELSERTQIARVARSVEDISTIRVASFRSRSRRLTKVARLRKDCQVAGEYAKSKGKRQKAKKESSNTGWRVEGVGGLYPSLGSRWTVAVGRCLTAPGYLR